MLLFVVLCVLGLQILEGHTVVALVVHICNCPEVVPHRCVPLSSFHPVGYTTDDLQFMWQTADPVQMDAIALPQFDIRREDIDYGNCTKYYAGTGTVILN